jgi:hypothetical protein
MKIKGNYCRKTQTGILINRNGKPFLNKDSYKYNVGAKNNIYRNYIKI